MSPRLAALLCAGAALSSAAPQWKLQFFHDVDRERFHIQAICFTSPQQGIAAGALVRDGRVQPAAALTGDGGVRWTLRPLNMKQPAVALHCGTGGRAWMATPEGIERSVDGGATWRRVLKREGVWAIWFADASHGWAAGVGRTLLETVDGGSTWTARDPGPETTTKERTIFRTIAFAGPQRGIVTGYVQPAPRDEDEDDPERPGLTVTAQTVDGGRTWKASSASVFGRISRMQLNPDHGVALLSFRRVFRWPAEILKLDTHGGASRTVLARADFAATDVALLEDGSAIAAGFEATGRLSATGGVPGRVRVFASPDLENWTEQPVDYRAVASRVVAFATGAKHAWLATDTGMILRLTEE